MCQLHCEFCVRMDNAFHRRSFEWYSQCGSLTISIPGILICRSLSANRFKAAWLAKNNYCFLSMLDIDSNHVYDICTYIVILEGRIWYCHTGWGTSKIFIICESQRLQDSYGYVIFGVHPQVGHNSREALNHRGQALHTYLQTTKPQSSCSLCKSD